MLVIKFKYSTVLGMILPEICKEIKRETEGNCIVLMFNNLKTDGNNDFSSFPFFYIIPPK